MKNAYSLMIVSGPRFRWTALCLALACTPRLGADCCGGRSALAAGSYSGDAQNHGSLVTLFGGSPGPRPVRITNSGPAPVDFSRLGNTWNVAGGESRSVNMNASSPANATTPQLPGEMTSSQVSGSGTSNSGTTTVEEEKTCPPLQVGATSANGGSYQQAEPKQTVPNPASPAAPAVTLPAIRQPVTQMGLGDAASPAAGDTSDFGFGGGSVMPGAVSLNSASQTVVTRPGVMVATSLGASLDGGPGRLGFVIPDKGPAGGYQFEQITDYAVRGVDLSGSYAAIAAAGAVRAQRRWSSSNGLTLLEQTTPNVAVTFKFYAPGNYSQTAPYNPTAAPDRSMLVEKLSTGNPNAALYDTGCRITRINPGRPDDVSSRWWNAAGTTLNAYTLANGVTTATSSTIPTATPWTRTVTTSITDSAGITRISEDVFRSVQNSDEQLISSKVYLTSSTSGPLLTTTYEYWPATGFDIGLNANQLKLQTNPDGSWVLHCHAVDDTRYTVSGWKSATPPAPINIETVGAVATWLVIAGTQGEKVMRYPSGRIQSITRYADSTQVGLTEFTDDLSHERTSVVQGAAGSFTTYTRDANYAPPVPF